MCALGFKKPAFVCIAVDTSRETERIKELELRTKQRDDYEEEIFKDMFPIKEELAYHKELLGHAYIDLLSPINIMSRAYYNKIREKSFQARRNPYQPYKFYNFVGRAKNVHLFIGCFVYIVDYMIMEDLGNIIDSTLSKVVLGKPFAQASKLAYDEFLRLIRFAHSDDEVVFRMPQRTKELDLSPLEKG
uniref:Protein kinase-like domain, concanavalin A-like lectin/glucanase domain protein n=1 Tax=Tanacetum cinerariifolium TaxID=118510 RepID=A0A699HIM7_TANCI|nr:protein kinase-like domain, concanavalin A-like lectin/glucanase domain protein [Tanacetum cinerariifolium]